MKYGRRLAPTVFTVTSIPVPSIGIKPLSLTKY